jgi:aminoglycoside phosphotransferase (APT) family kinase protein
LPHSESNTALGEVRGDVERFLSERLGRRARVVGAKLLAGGASQECWSIDAALEPDDECLEFVMRRDMGGVLTTQTLARDAEFAVIAAAHAAGVPAPKPYFEPTTIAGKPAFFMQRVIGEAVGRRVVSEPSLAHARERLPEQLASALAAIHRIDYQAAGLDVRLEGPGEGRTAIRSEIERLYRELDSVDEAHPAIELALRWLILREPPPERERTLVHGDFRIGNLMVDENGLVAILDWEFAHIGDPTEDVVWPLVRAWRFGNVALDAGGFADRETWLRAYENASGRQIDRRRVAYLEILGNVRWAVGALMQARRHLSGGEPSIELASLGRISAEMEDEALRLIRGFA